MSELNRNLRILLVNTLDREGGAEQVASSLLQGYRARGHDAWLAVGVKRSQDSGVLTIDNTRTNNPWARVWWTVQEHSVFLHGKQGRWGERIRRSLGMMAAPRSIIEMLRGHEHSHYPGTYNLLDLPPQQPDILHCHSLQRGYFELEALPLLSRQVPTVLTLHDAWLLSGHCTHPFGCSRWRTGCGSCPDLTIPPALLRDGTARNWQRKRKLFELSRLWVAADSKWLLEKVRASMLTHVDARVIYPGIDLSVFRPGSREQARQTLGLPPSAQILLFVAHRARSNPWKDFRLLQQVVARVRQLVSKEIILLVAGDPVDKKTTIEGNVWLAPPIDTAVQLALYYRAADVYVHATHVETFGLTIVEAMASGLPVVATRTAAIPELIPADDAGFLTTPNAVEEMAARVVALLNDNELRSRMGRRATQTARFFDVNNTISAYLDYYQTALEWEQASGSRRNS